MNSPRVSIITPTRDRARFMPRIARCVFWQKTDWEWHVLDDSAEPDSFMQQLAAQDRPIMTPEKAVWRLTGEIADWYGIDAGKILPGARADMVLIDPDALRAADVGEYAEARFDELGGLLRVVNRNDGVVKTVIINGNLAFENDQPASGLGTASVFGRFLPRTGHAQQ